jgi:uncharacterized protein (TIGR02117 family)
MRRIVVVLCVGLAGCAALRPSPDLTEGPKTETVYLVQRGWHTDIGMAADQPGSPLSQVRSVFPGVKVMLFGFGERAYLMHREHGFADMLAALLPGPGALLVTALSVRPADAFPPQDVVALHVSARGLARLSEFIAGSFEWTADGRPRAIADGPYPGSVFYASTTRYSGVFTCNTWTAEGLQSAGLPIRAAGTLFAGEVIGRARTVAAQQ